MWPAFDYANFLLAYPQFVGYLDETAVTDIYTYEALELGTKIIQLFQDVNTAYYWSCVVLAHILTMQQLGLTGRVNNATEGSVSGAFEKLGGVDESWWNITLYGQKCWKLIQQRGGATWIPAGNSANVLPFTWWPW